MKDVFFKIIIPNYNNIKFIRQCIDSILSQTFQDFIIIIIDDNSVDGSDSICKEYQEKNPDKIIYKKLNQRNYAGICRNIGIDYPINCKYIWAIDGDDYVYSKDALKILYSYANTEKYDAIFFDGYLLKNKKIVNIPEKIHFDPNDPSKCNPTCHWLNIAKPQYFSKYLENCMIGQDLYHSYLMLDSIKTYKCINDKLYVYRYNKESVSHIKLSRNDIKLRENHRQFLRNEIAKLQSYIKNPNININIKARLKMIDARILHERKNFGN